MSRENKVNPGQYTQRGRLTPDEGAQEIAKQRASGSERTPSTQPAPQAESASLRAGGSGSKAVPKKAAAKKKGSAA